MDSSVKESFPKKIQETGVILNTGSNPVTKECSYDISLKFSDKKTTAGILSPLDCDVSPPSQLHTENSKLNGKESKSCTISKMCVPSNPTSAGDGKEQVSSDCLVYPKFTSLLKDNVKISSKEKNNSLISPSSTESNVTTKGNVPIKMERSNISTRPRRIIKARRPFSSSSFSTGVTKPKSAGESSSGNELCSKDEKKNAKCSSATKNSKCSSATKNGKCSSATKNGKCSSSTKNGKCNSSKNSKCNSATKNSKCNSATKNGKCSDATKNGKCSDATKNGKCSDATKKLHKTKIITDKDTFFPLKKLASRPILPAVKTDSTHASKNCLLIKSSSNVTQVPSDNSRSLGCTYLLTSLNLTTAENNSLNPIKTPTMSSNSDVTSTSPTYCNSNRNVTTTCSSAEEKSTVLTFGESDDAFANALKSFPSSASNKTWKISSLNLISEESLDNNNNNNNRSDTLQNCAVTSLSKKKNNSNCPVDATSNSLGTKSCDSLLPQITKEEMVIKKESLVIKEIDPITAENRTSATILNSSADCASTKETTRKLSNTACSNSKVSHVQNLVGSSAGNSQTKPATSVHLNSPYTIFLPVSLPSSTTTTATVTATTTSASVPLYNIQMTVPNAVRTEKPFMHDDGSISNKQCAAIPAITFLEADRSSMKPNLISQNNLIASYHPAPLPESLMNKLEIDYHPCEQCGDTFLFESSLTTHKMRKCMQLTYNCDNCQMKIVFYNKCSVLEHIRSHYPTTPVTIKLERMEVMPLSEGVIDVLEIKDESKEVNSYRNLEGASKFDCIECGENFSNATALADHFGHSDLVCTFTYYCALCQIYLPRRCAQLAHRRLHHEMPPHVCPDCGQLISNILHFREHLKYTCLHFSRVAPISCPKFCISKFCYTSKLKEHIISVHSETFIKCSKCPMAFKAFGSYQTHHKSSHPSELEQIKEISKCPLCDTVFHSHKQLLNHVDIHIGELKKNINYVFRCFVCYSTFAKRSQLVSHLKSCHDSDYMLHRCEFCGCTCKSAYYLQIHQRTIHKVELKKSENDKKTKAKPVAPKMKKNKDTTHCSFCHVYFANQAQLQMHSVKVHQRKINDLFSSSTTSLSPTPVPKNKNSQKFCHYCKAPYKSWSHLMQHILGHRNFGVYICLICIKAVYVTKKELIRHEELCSTEILHDKLSFFHECEECHQLFKQESLLIAHQKNIHPKKSTSFNCSVCDLPYKSNSDLLKHMQTMHEDKILFSCSYCKELAKNITFRSQDQLEKHIKTKHTSSPNETRLKQSDAEEKNKNSHLPDKNKPKDSQTALKCRDVPPAKKAKLSTKKEEETYICIKCNFTSRNFDVFQLHIREHKSSEDDDDKEEDDKDDDEEEEDGIRCRICGLPFTTLDSLRMHLFAVHKKKCSNGTVQDKYVGKSSVSKKLDENSLDTVGRLASDSFLPVENTNKCSVESVNKTVEPVKHNSDKKSSPSDSNSCQCSVCNKIFETEHLLKVHMRTHGMAFIRSKYHITSDSSNS